MKVRAGYPLGLQFLMASPTDPLTFACDRLVADRGSRIADREDDDVAHVDSRLTSHEKSPAQAAKRLLDMVIAAALLAALLPMLAAIAVILVVVPRSRDGQVERTEY